jgi:hypothetical protein
MMQWICNTACLHLVILLQTDRCSLGVPCKYGCGWILEVRPRFAADSVPRELRNLHDCYNQVTVLFIFIYLFITFMSIRGSMSDSTF